MSLTDENQSTEFLQRIGERLATGKYDFIDFGCGKGGSIEVGKIRFHGRGGLGIDIDPARVVLARSLGHDAEVGDLTNLRGLAKRVRFSIMSHFLEHLKSIELAKTCIMSAITVSSEFVFIQQPYFDADTYLFKNDLKFYWSDWRGHPNRMTFLEFHNILKPLQEAGAISRFGIYGWQAITDSDNPTILPLSAPSDQLDYELDKHGPKKQMAFTEDVFRETRVLIGVGASANFDELETRFLWTKKMFDSRA